MLRFQLLIGTGLAACLALSGCGHHSASPPPQYYVRTNLVAASSSYVDSAGSASHTDARLANPWGIAYSPTGPLWVADNVAGGATVYDGGGNSVSANGVAVPILSGKTGSSLPTGVVYNGTTDF